MALVVFEQNEVVIGDFSVRCIDVDSVDRARLQPAIGKIVIEAAHVFLWQTVCRAQCRPAVAAVEKLVGKPERKFGMTPKIGNFGHAVTGCCLFRDADRIGIVEAQRRRHPDTLFRQCGAQ